jgi:chemotaxis family two-component system response regulator Rcp1
MTTNNTENKVDILLCEDNIGDQRLTIEVFKDSKVCNRLHIVADGIEALAFLHKEGKYANVPTPDLILLDLNMPRKDGREVLAEIKADKVLKRIPVVILTTSQAEADILKMYGLNANCYITKPVDLDQFLQTIHSLQDFWFSIVQLPPKYHQED